MPLPFFNREPSPVSLSLAIEREAEAHARIERMRKAWLAYSQGQPPELDVAPGEHDDNVVVPHEELVVNKGRSFLFGHGIEFEVPEDQPTDVEAAQEYLDQTWKRNRKLTTLLKLATNGGVFGHAFVKIVPDDRDPEYPRLVVLNTMEVDIAFEEEDIERTIGYSVQWTGFNADGDPVIRRELVEEEAPGVWTITRQHTNLEGMGWTTDSGPSEWPYEWPPIADCQNLPVPNEVFGRSDIEEGHLRLGRAINRLLTNMNRIIRMHAHPHLFITGANVAALKEMIQNGELTLEPDSITLLPGNLRSQGARLEATKFESDLTQSIELYKKLREAYHEITRVPEVSTGKVDTAGNISGVALQILYGPIMEQTEDKRNTYGDMLEEVNRRILDYGGFGERVEVHNRWADPMPQDDVAEAQGLEADQRMGASKRTLLQKRGYDPDVELQQAQDEASAALELQRQRVDAGLGFGADEAPDDEEE